MKNRGQRTFSNVLVQFILTLPGMKRIHMQKEATAAQLLTPQLALLNIKVPT
jgi:hypothetical protein